MDRRIGRPRPTDSAEWSYPHGGFTIRPTRMPVPAATKSLHHKTAGTSCIGTGSANNRLNP